MPIAAARKRFGTFELDSRTGELRTNGARVKLQGQPISVLEILLETPGELVTREQIRERLWSSDTFVDFDHNLNTAIKKLRQALGDEAETPRYIETIPRYGYRFIGQVEKEAAPDAVVPPPEPASAEPASTAPEKSSPLRRALPWALGGIAVLIAGVAGWLLKPAPQPNVIRFAVAPPENTELVYGGEMSLSPDGRTLAFIARPDPNKPQVLWLRRLDSVMAQPVPGTEGATLPFWSPDSRQIGFAAYGKLGKVAVSGGAPEFLCDINTSGATWNRDGVILFSSDSNLYAVRDTGGAPKLVLAPDASHQEMDLRFPQFLPDGRHFLFLAVLSASGSNFLEVGSLDSKTTERLMQTESQAAYAPPGYLFYANQSTLVARPFDARALGFTGPALPLAQGLSMMPYHYYSYFSVSPAGVLAYQADQHFETSQITWFDRAGKKLGTVGQPGMYAAPAISPDGSKLGVAVGEYGKRNLWIYDLKRGAASRLTFDAADDTNTTWSPDGSKILFSSSRDGTYDIFQKGANGLGSAEPVFKSKSQRSHIDDITSDGRYLVYDTAGGNTELWVLPLFGDRNPYPFVQGNFRAQSATFSPNGRYVAYASNETGRLEVYVETFLQQTGKWQISASGGNEPMWRRDGKELFYLGLGGKLMAVDVDANAATFEVGIPKPLFQTQLDARNTGRNFYVVAPDGQRFLMLVTVEPSGAAPITVVVNWPALLKK